MSFHTDRHMFAIDTDTILIASAGVPYSHHEWLTRFSFDFKRCPRGYYLNGRLRIYVDEFSHRVNHSEIRKVLPLLVKIFPDAKEIEFGAIPGPDNQEWEPRSPTLPIKWYMENK